MVEKKDSGQLEAVNTPFPKTTASYRDWAVEAIAADVKESLCRVHENTFTEGMNVPTVAYELPDGHEIHVGAARFKVSQSPCAYSLFLSGARMSAPSRRGAVLTARRLPPAPCAGRTRLPVRRRC